MRILTSMKFLVVSLVIIGACSYLIYTSTWFQKKYLYPFPYKDTVYRYALENSLDPFLVVSVMRTESKFVTKARSSKGATGLMQLMPETAQWVAGQLDDSSFTLAELDNPEVNIRLGTWYLASLNQEFKENEILALAAYNGGRGNVKQWMQQYEWSMSFHEVETIPFSETREYVSKVLRNKRHYQELYKD